MIVTCPNCRVRYFVAKEALGRVGRTVRCMRCSNTWFQDPFEDEPTPRPAENRFELPDDFSAMAPDDDTESGMEDNPGPDFEALADEPMPSFIGRGRSAGPGRSGSGRLPALVKPKRGLTPVQLGWIGLGSAIIILAVILIFFPAEVVSVWPAADRLYLAFGKDVGTAELGLEVRGLNSARTTIDGQPTLIVAGEIANISNTPRPVPKLRMNLRNAQNQVIKSWDFSTGRAQLLPGESAPFNTSITTPPHEASSAYVTFIGE